jgi:hypothetical protein
MPWQTGTLGGVPAPETSIPRAALTRYLRELPNYVVLRNEEDLLTVHSTSVVGGDPEW